MEEIKCIICGKKKSSTEQQKKQKKLFCPTPTKHMEIHRQRVKNFASKIERIGLVHYKRLFQFKWAKEEKQTIREDFNQRKNE